jgi:molybdenum cofactor cytidylyltransferase
VKTELILLAAGQSKRFGGIKQLTDIHGQPMICHCLSQYRQGEKWLTGITNGYVVLGANAELINEVLPNNVTRYVANSWQLGMGHSLAESMHLIASDTTHVLIALADQVALTQNLVIKMLQELNRYPQHIIAAKYAGIVGAPTTFPKQYFFQLSQLKGDKGAKTLLQQYSQQVIGLTMPEAALDIDTPDDLKFV